MANKSTRAEVQKRIRIVLDLLLQSTPRVDIVQYATKFWDITEWGVDKYIAQANKIMMEQAQRERDEIFAENFAQRQYLKNKAIKKEAYGLAHDIIKDEAKLFGLYPVEKRHIELVEKELSSALDALQQRLEPDVYQKVIAILANETSEAEADSVTD